MSSPPRMSLCKGSIFSLQDRVSLKIAQSPQAPCRTFTSSHQGTARFAKESRGSSARAGSDGTHGNLIVSEVTGKDAIAGLRPLGVQLPLPTPTLKAARDAGLEHIGNSTNELAGSCRNLLCDAAVTGRGRSPE